MAIVQDEISLVKVSNGKNGEDGVNGIQGPKGDKGIPGEKGADGRTQYTHIAYSNSSDGTKDFSLGDSNRDYIGMYVDFNENDSTKPSDYSWSLIKGADGTQGTPGKAGADGKTSYFHTAWSNSPDGKKDFTTGYPNENLLKIVKDKEYTASREFVTSVDWDMAPSIDKYGLKQPITYTFEIKGKVAGKFNFYFQNGSGSKHTFEGYKDSPSSRNLTTEWVKHTIRVTSHRISSTTETRSQIAFFSTYDSGAIMTIRNLKAELGEYATPGIETPIMPLSYMGTYTDFEINDSEDPSKYTWAKILEEPYKTHKAWSWSADGTDRFTDKYPNENLVSEKDVANCAFANDIVSFNPAWRSFIIECNENSVYSLTRQLLNSNRFRVGFTETKPRNNEGTKLIDSMNPYYYQLRASDKFDSAYEIINILSPSKAKYLVIYMSNASEDITKSKLKVEEYKSPTIYTPSPKDDFDNAWPKYEGYYSSHNPVQSTNPSDYTWSVIRGENGKDGTDGKNGTDGKDGITPKDVISGYLSNESIIVPATPTGTVTDFSQAFGDFVVFEGQTKKTSGVTYSKVSEVGMTSTINSNGRYVVSALSADTGTATYRATYSGVTIDKIMIVVKNKQGQSGADGKDGQQGIQGVPGKDGSDGKDGATGPQGPPTGITTSPTVPTNPYVNMLWQNTGNIPGYITGVTYQWNGAKWNIYIFRAENIAANYLSAISADLGTITAGEILTTFFRGDSLNGAIKKRGSTIISDGQFKSSFDYVLTTDNSILGKGDVVLDENGFMVRDLTTNDETLRSTAYNPEGVFMTDKNMEFGTVALKYQDLMNVSPTQLRPAAGYSIYSTSETNIPTAKREGRSVTLSGAFKNNNNVTSSYDEILLGYLPEWAIPTEPRFFIVQGSGMNRFTLTVRPDAKIYWSRYGTTAPITANAGAWLNLSCSFSARDIGG